MKTSIRYIFLFAIMGLSFYAISSCNKDNPAETTTPYKIDILKTDEFGNILGGDYSDWCLHNPVDTFTYIVYFNVSLPQNNISLLKWTTRKQYSCYGFDIERKKSSDTSFIKIGFVQGAGNSNDSIKYAYYDTLQPNHPNYVYRLKQLDIYGGYIYRYEIGPISGIIPNASFGPAFPNPSTTSFIIGFQIPRVDTISIYFASFTDTVFFINNERKMPGAYELYINNNSNYHNVQKRLYIRSSTIRNADSCSLYGDIQFN